MSRTTCPDCNEELQPIKILDATMPGYVYEGRCHIELSYSASDTKPSFFSHTIEKQGTVHGKICPKCGRILLYAGPI